MGRLKGSSTLLAMVGAQPPTRFGSPTLGRPWPMNNGTAFFLPITKQ